MSGFWNAGKRGAAPVAQRVQATNNASLPSNYNTTPNWVQNAWTTHTFAALPIGETWNDFQPTFVNWLLITNGEEAGHYDFDLDAGLLYNGTFYPFLWNGSPTPPTVSKNFGHATPDALHIPGGIPGGATIIITNRRVASDGGVAGSYDVITSTGGILARNDGQLQGTDNTKNFTQGVGVGYGATVAALTGANVSGGVIQNNLAVGAQGQGYTGVPSMGLWYGPAGQGSPFSKPGSGASGFGHLTADKVTSLTVSGGGSAYDATALPQVFLGGGGGFPAASTASYGPAAVTAVPSVAATALHIIGDSIAEGYLSVDSTGDIRGNYGWYEQAVNGSVGVQKMAVNGQEALGFVSTHTRQLEFIDYLIGTGMRLGYVGIFLGTNDFLASDSGSVGTALTTNMNTIAGYFRSRGAKGIFMATVPPNNTAVGNDFTQVANQSPKVVSGTTNNYKAGGRVEAWNAGLLAGTGPTCDGVVDGSALMRDSLVTSAWRTDAAAPALAASAFCAVDGTHPSLPIGIPYLTAHAVLPPMPA